jgi:hypothetical protein
MGAGTTVSGSVGGDANRGAGGYGGRGTSFTGGSGGSGIVVFSYPDTYAAAIATTGSPSVTVSGGYRIYTFNSSGTIQFYF